MIIGKMSMKNFLCRIMGDSGFVCYFVQSIFYKENSIYLNFCIVTILMSKILSVLVYISLIEIFS